MSLNRKILFLKTQILETEKLLNLVGNHPIMSKNLNEKLEDLKIQINSIPAEYIEPKLEMLFSGNAVKGSLGIKSKFVSETIKSLQELIKTQTELVRFGIERKNGSVKSKGNSELYLTALPTGSFGFELKQIDNNDLFDGNDVAQAIQQIMHLIEATSKSDEMFEDAIENAPKKNLSNLKKFLKTISDENSILKMESGSFSIEIPEKDIVQAYERVDKTFNEENELFVSGILKGFLLESGRFEITTLEGRIISGIINHEITQEQLIDYTKEFFNKECRIHLITNKITFKTGKEKINYELSGIDKIDII